MLKKYLLPAFNWLVQPLPYPVCLGYHVIVGSTLIWFLRGAPRVYSVGQLASGILLSLVGGVLLVLAANELTKRVK